MRNLKTQHVALLLSDLLLIASIIIPWFALPSAVYGEPLQGGYSWDAIWASLFNAPVGIGGSIFIVFGLGYLGAKLTVVGLSAPIIRGSIRREFGVASLALGVLSGAVITFLWGTFAWFILPGVLSVETQVKDSILYGIPFVLVGSLLAAISLAYISVTSHPSHQPISSK